MARPQKIKRVVIAGGGTAGWVTAAALSRLLGPLLDITLVESDAIGTVGVGEATIPTQRTFHHLIDLDEAEFMKATQATFKLGIAFENWGQPGDRYIHSFGRIGQSTWMGHFYNLWLHARDLGIARPLDDYCFELRAANAGKFYTGEKAPTNFAYHLDATAYARFLRTFSERHGAKRVEGKIANVRLNGESGHIEALELESGQSIEGDFFIDCTGFRALLIEGALKAGYEDWSHLLPANRAIAVQTAKTEDARPYTRAIAHSEGWRWKIPLQHRTGNGVVYCSDYLDDETARERLLSAVEGEVLTDPRVIRFQTGKRKNSWVKNCVALGLSSGFLEPLESTSIHLIQIGVTRLIQNFPFDGVTDALASRFNDLLDRELLDIRDFLILHYVVNQRGDSPFWVDRANQQIPDSLAQRIELFKRNAMTFQVNEELFRIDSWVQVMRGQNLESEGYHRFGALMSDQQVQGAMNGLAERIDRAVGQMPTHEAFIRSYCPAPEPS